MKLLSCATYIENYRLPNWTILIVCMSSLYFLLCNIIKIRRHSRDRTFHRLIRSPRSSEVANSSHNTSAFAFDSTILKFDNSDFDSDSTNVDSDLGVCISKFSLDNMVDNNRTLKELAIVDIMCQPWCIRYPKLEQAQSYELKFGLIHLLLKFHGLKGTTQQLSVKGSIASRVMNELTIGQHHISPLVRVCGICASVEHLTDACLTLQETKPNKVKVDAMMVGQQYRQPYDQYSNWRYGSHPTQSTNIARVVDFIAVQPPLPSIVQSLHPLVITTNKLQAEQKERLLQHLKKLRDFYGHLVKHSTFRFPLKKPPEDVTLELNDTMTCDCLPTHWMSHTLARMDTPNLVPKESVWRNLHGQEMSEPPTQRRVNTRDKFSKHTSNDSAYIVKSSMKTSMQSSNKYEKMLIIHLWNILGALHKPNGIRVNVNSCTTGTLRVSITPASKVSHQKPKPIGLKMQANKSPNLATKLARKMLATKMSNKLRLFPPR
ncbi:hypothetical protein CR513_22369, partial [Mucuna pruriens]